MDDFLYWLVFIFVISATGWWIGYESGITQAAVKPYVGCTLLQQQGNVSVWQCPEKQ